MTLSGIAPHSRHPQTVPPVRTVLRYRLRPLPPASPHLRDRPLTTPAPACVPPRRFVRPRPPSVYAPLTSRPIADWCPRSAPAAARSAAATLRHLRLRPVPSAPLSPPVNPQASSESAQQMGNRWPPGRPTLPAIPCRAPLCRSFIQRLLPACQCSQMRFRRFQEARARVGARTAKSSIAASDAALRPLYLGGISSFAGAER